jgi:hypothetical protein
MKIFKIIAWISGIFASIVLIVGIISLLTGTTLLGIRHVVNYFHVANSTLLLAILCVLARQGCLHTKE